VNINLVSMDGGWKSTATGLASYKSLPTTTSQEMQHSKSFMGPAQERAALLNLAMGECSEPAA